ncbi:hypothetical protein ECE50_003600 [Chitinophaga sp. Mgbs1]|uniref:Uncharacterized protein n=1 Tax=Chitinophaga solisilvae TaxID=1233460 RepID=A0A433WI19_9BACT|nr:hypothetical protein [Chitinophaga solisilvae]
MYFKLNINIKAITVCLAAMVLAAGCIKSSDSPLLPAPMPEYNQASLKQAITSMDTLNLFYQAIDKAGYSSQLAGNDVYTVFAPGNTAMQAAGLNAEKIRQLTPDSLRKLVGYHMLAGAYDDYSLRGLLLTSFVPTLREDTVLIPQQQFYVKKSWLSIQQSDQLYLNSCAVGGKIRPLACANGFIYPIGSVVNFAPVDESRTMWEVIENDPELSMYRDAVLLLDSIKQTDVYFEGTVFGSILTPPLDYPLLSERKTNPDNGTVNPRSTPAVFAPTNKAFHDAGFHSLDDLRALAYRYPFGVTGWANEDYTEVMITFRFSSLDTLLARNILVSGNGDAARYPLRILYSDLVKGTVNNGIFNRMTRVEGQSGSTYIRYPFDLQFSAANGVAYMQWRSNGDKIIIPKDDNPLKPVNNFNVDNGVIYKVDKLFYPFN